VITFIGSVTSVPKKEITPHQPKEKLMSDILKKWESIHRRHRRPLIELRNRRITRPTFWWKVTCLVGAHAVQAWQ
jgi:hypothetical protein